MLFRSASVFGNWALGARGLARPHFAQLDTASQNLSDEQDGSILRLLVEVRRWSAKHPCGNVLGTVGQRFENEGNTYSGGHAHLRTRTDHPRFAGSEHNVSRREERTCAVSVLESVVVERYGGEDTAIWLAYRQNRVPLVIPYMRQDSRRHRIPKVQEPVLFLLHRHLGCRDQRMWGRESDRCRIR